MDHAAEAQRTDLMTITRHVLNEQSRHPESRGDFTILLSHIVLGCKFVASAVNKAGLAKLIGLAGETNVQASKQSTTTRFHVPPLAPITTPSTPRLSCAYTRTLSYCS